MNGKTTWRSEYRGRPIKFRGRVLAGNKQDGGKIVYGMLSICTLKDKTHWIYPLDGGWGWEVEPESVAQLIGYDSNGAEVYEGDVLVDDNDQCKPPYNEFTVEFKVHGYKHGSSVTFETHTREYRLKEAAS